MSRQKQPIQVLTSKPDYEINNEVLATYNSLGYQEDGQYHMEPDCKACIKDLMRFLRTDNQHTFPIRRQLGASNIVTNDLIPILKLHAVNDIELFDLVLRLLVSLTNPAILLFKEQVPDDKEKLKIFLDLISHLFAYKQTMARDVKMWSVVAKHLLRILQQPIQKREEDDKIMFERMLILIRNVLHVPSEDANETVWGENNTHDLLLIALQRAGIYDIFLYVCSMPEEHELCFHILEIFSLMFREQEARSLAETSNTVKKSDYERKSDVDNLKNLLARDRSRVGTSKNTFDRFKGSTYTVKNFKVIGDRDMICHKTISDVNEISFDKDKRQLKKAKNRQHMKDNAHISSRERIHCSSFEVKRYLKDLCTNFLQNSYNMLMKRVRHYLERNTSQENDETYYLWASEFFMQFNRHSSASCELVIETLNTEYLHYLHCLIETHLDRIKTDKAKFAQWSKRLHFGLKAYKELICTVAHIHQAHRFEAAEAADEIKRKIFYEQDYRELIRTLLLVYDPVKMSDGYLLDLIEANHMFLKLFEHYAKHRDKLVVAKKKRKIRRKPKAKKMDSKVSLEIVWTEIAQEVSTSLQEMEEVPRLDEETDSALFDPLSEKSKDDQKLDIMKRVNRLLRDNQTRKAVAIYRTARYYYIEDNDHAFGHPGVNLEEELAGLQEILVNQFLTEITVEEPNEDENEEEDEDDENDEQYQEQEMKFLDFVKTYASPKLIIPFCLALKNYEHNPQRINSCIIKMFHRLAFDCQMYVQFLQLSVLRIFQQMWNKHHGNEIYSELIRFAKFLVVKMVEVSQKNDKLFLEILYWKTTREAYEIEEGYAAQPPTKERKTKKSKKRDESDSEEILDEQIPTTVMEIDEDNQEKKSEKKSRKRKADDGTGQEKTRKKKKSKKHESSMFSGDEAEDSDQNVLSPFSQPSLDENSRNSVLSNEDVLLKPEECLQKENESQLNTSLTKLDSPKKQSASKKKRRMVFEPDSDNEDHPMEVEETTQNSDLSENNDFVQNKRKRRAFLEEEDSQDVPLISNEDSNISENKLVDNNDNSTESQTFRKMKLPFEESENEDEIENNRPKKSTSVLDDDDDLSLDSLVNLKPLPPRSPPKDFENLLSNPSDSEKSEPKKRARILESDDDSSQESALPQENLESTINNLPESISNLDESSKDKPASSDNSQTSVLKLNTEI